MNHPQPPSPSMEPSSSSNPSSLALQPISAMDNIAEDLLHHILSFLPFPSVIRSRIVSRRWNSILTSPPFFSIWNFQRSPSFWLLRLHHNCRPFIVDPSLLRCLSLPWQQQLPLADTCHGVLVLLHSSAPISISLLNPLTRRALVLPRSSRVFSILNLGITANPSFSSFLIIACGFPGTLASETHQAQVEAEAFNVQTMCAELFDSRLGYWVALPSPSHLLLDARSPPLGSQRFVWWNGKFCILSGNRIIAYDIVASAWSSIRLPSLPRIWNPTFLTLHAIRDRLFVEGNFQEQGDFQRRYPLRIGILEFDQCSQTWLEVAFMPDELSRKLCIEIHPAHSKYVSYSSSRDDILCFSPYPGRNMESTVLFHISRRQWSAIVVPAHQSHDDEDDIFPGTPAFKGFLFQPNLSALSFAASMAPT